MLQIGNIVLKNDEYYIKKMLSGIDELFFDISIWDENYQLIAEEESIIETEHGQTFLVKAIDEGAGTATIRCLLDLDDFYGTITVPYTNGSDTLSGTVSMPSGWTFYDYSLSSISRTITLPSATQMDIISQCISTYSVVFRFDNKLKTVSAYDPDAGTYAGAFMTRNLNLKEINFKGVSTDIITALYCVGKDGLTFADINDGKAYVTNGTYKSKTIWGYWKDDRYTDAESLLADGTARLAQLSVPSRSYQCDVVDLAKTNPDVYAFENFDILSVIDLVDDSRGSTIRNKVVEYVDYPYHPERNIVTISSTTPKISMDVKQLNVSLSSQNSAFQQILSAAQDSATRQLIGGTGGYVVMHTNDQNRIYEILIMDTADITTATKVWRWNSGGLGYSSTGYNGTYTTAITQDGAIVADFVTTGTLDASLISVINLIAEHVLAMSADDSYSVDIQQAIIKVLEGTYIRAVLFSTTTGTPNGQMVLAEGNVIYSGPGTSIYSGMQDDAARVSWISPNEIVVGADRNAVKHGNIFVENIYAKAISPNGESLHTLTWKEVDLAAGGTAWALCQA